ncbi:hypothetical protein GCM10010869_22280 [Mesorhizobium tianshanense]|nr:hypothetical protein GCM10010869_22280 [Mesorhizobium tianshanense]
MFQNGCEFRGKNLHRVDIWRGIKKALFPQQQFTRVEVSQRAYRPTLIIGLEVFDYAASVAVERNQADAERSQRAHRLAPGLGNLGCELDQLLQPAKGRAPTVLTHLDHFVSDA